jgi:hypothetical protein
MCGDTTSSTRAAEYIEGKTDNPGILEELESFITIHCTHGAKKPISHQSSENSEPALYCCLKCSVAFIWGQRANSMITNRTKTTTGYKNERQ